MLKEEKVYINDRELRLEGLLDNSSADQGVVICHPHPQMGGSMHNNVVEAIQRAFAAERYSTLRFNFRGVGGSSGMYDEGRGEKEDILAAGRYLQGIGVTKIFFAGYSFGAWVGSKIIEQGEHPFAGVTLVAPPINYFDFDLKKLKNKINMIVCGTRDQFCDLDILKEHVKYINAHLEVIAGADHFYDGQEEMLTHILRKNVK